MPKGPRGEKRPGDVIGAAIMVAKIATGEVEDNVPDRAQQQSRAGKAGGAARARTLTEAERSKIAAKAAKTRWQRDRPAPAKKEQT